MQLINDERQPFVDGLVENPGSDSCKINNSAGYIRGLSKTEGIIRKMVEDLENGNLRTPDIITISPLGHPFQPSNTDLNFRR